MLRQMRQSAGIDPVLLASALKITPQKIQALEEGRLDDLPGLTFVRGLAAALCRYFAADPRPVLALLPQAVSGVPLDTETQHEAFKPSTFYAGSSGAASSGQRAGVPGWLLAVVAVLLVAALAIWLAPGQWFMPRPSSPAASDADDRAAQPPAPVAEPAPAPELPASPAADAASPSGPAASAPVGMAVASAAQASVPLAAPQPGEGTAEQDVLTFKAAGHVWVGVKDGTGKLVISRFLNSGDSLSVGGALPLSVTVGDKRMATVTVRGQPLDLNEHTRSGVVARFTVEPVASP
jgi:cytoskeleton protein RodZ